MVLGRGERVDEGKWITQSEQARASGKRNKRNAGYRLIDRLKKKKKKKGKSEQRRRVAGTKRGEKRQRENVTKSGERDRRNVEKKENNRGSNDGRMKDTT